MYFSPLFAAEKLNIDPGTLNVINAIGLVVMGMVILALLGYAAWHYAPILVARSRSKRAEKIKVANSIWFDAKESFLHCGQNKKYIELNSFEYFVCKTTLKEPNKYHGDYGIFEDAERAAKQARETRRGVEQAVRRLNQKARKLGLQNDLFKRSKERTAVNDEYRQHIVN